MHFNSIILLAPSAFQKIIHNSRRWIINCSWYDGISRTIGIGDFNRIQQIFQHPPEFVQCQSQKLLLGCFFFADEKERNAIIRNLVQGRHSVFFYADWLTDGWEHRRKEIQIFCGRTKASLFTGFVHAFFKKKAKHKPIIKRYISASLTTPHANGPNANWNLLHMYKCKNEKWVHIYILDELYTYLLTRSELSMQINSREGNRVSSQLHLLLGKTDAPTNDPSPMQKEREKENFDIERKENAFRRAICVSSTTQEMNEPLILQLKPALHIFINVLLSLQFLR